MFLYRNDFDHDTFLINNFRADSFGQGKQLNFFICENAMDIPESQAFHGDDESGFIMLKAEMAFGVRVIRADGIAHKIVT